MTDFFLKTFGIFFYCFFCSCISVTATGLDERKERTLDYIYEQELKQGVIEVWVDHARWSIAHSCLVRKSRLDEANRYLSELQLASSTHGLISDTDVQVTDLLRTWMEFGSTTLMNDDAKKNLLKIFTEWEVPN
ncbi:MAG: hypothetical protein GX811_10830, partial [Lentisphaerae bacterium]|nr:hypothetical protein [Lentisphaerota bacterium]